MTDVDVDPPPHTASMAAAERTRNRRGEGDRLRLDLLDAAADLLAEKGDVDAVSLRAIAARAGVSPTAVYRHFDDHTALLRAAVEYCWEEFRSALVGADDPAATPHDRLRASGLAYMRFADEQPGKYRVLFSNKIDLGRDEPSVGESAFEWLVGLVTLILDANDDRRDPRFVAVQVHTWIHGIVDLCTSHDDFAWPSLEIQIAELGYRLGLVEPGASAPPPWTGPRLGPDDPMPC